MNRRDFLKGAVAASGLALTQLPDWLGAAGPEANKPNIVLLMTDDQGWAETGYRDHPHLKTPNLDKMAAGGLRFDRFYSSAPVCSPTRASVLTGRHPARFNCMKVADPIKTEELTIAEVLRGAGYRTGFFGKWHINDYRKTGSGLAIGADDPLHPGRLGFDQWVAGRNYFDLDPTLSRNGKAEEFKGDTSDILISEAMKFIHACADRDEPFLAVVWYPSPHGPHEALEEDRAPYAHLDKKDQERYGELRGVDRSIGRLRDELRQMGIEKDTLLWFCSDNGGTLGGSREHRDRRYSVRPLRGNKNRLYEGGIRVPGIIEWPGHIEAGQTTDTPASTMDIYPTLLDLLGLDMPESQPMPLDGITIAPALKGDYKVRGKPIPFWHIRLRGKQESLALIDGRYKLHRAPPDEQGDVHLELFDLIEDPGESEDLADQRPELVKEMKEKLEAWRASVRRSQTGADYKAARR